MLAKEFLKFVDASPSPFHAVQSCIQRLTDAGFTEIFERDSWETIAPGGKYFFTRNKSALVAFCVGGKFKPGNGFSIVGAHTDSPCLKIKPRSKKDSFGYLQVGVELYGGGLWHTWFDRDLSVAGRVLIQENDSFQHRLVHINRPILRIPTLAIHLDRSVKEGFKFNEEVQLTPILAEAAARELNKNNGSQNTLHHPEFLKLIATQLNINVDQICDFELCLYDTQPASLGGLDQEFIHSARLDNLMMSFCALNAIIDSRESVKEDSLIRIVGLFDNEEVGSQTAHGADSNLLPATLSRLCRIPIGTQVFDTDWEVVPSISEGVFERAIAKSLLISADMAHALHPNYSEKHEANHRPAMNRGVVIKQNANQRYATTSISTLLTRQFAKIANIPLQEFVVRNDSPCGSTIGPMLSAKLGLRTIDWSMHSIRETCGVEDVEYAVKLFKAFFENMAAIDSKLKL